MCHLLTGCLLLLMGTVAPAQPKPRKLNPALNNPSFNYWAPYVCLDGNTILFTSDYTEDNLPAIFIAVKQGVDWKEPVPLTKKITALSFTKAFTLSVDGKMLYITSSRGGTIGGFDILTSQISGGAFGEPTFLGAPINSPTNEGAPTFSPDGATIFFMRCAKMR